MKTPISEALKTFNPKKEPATIRICGCGTPLIWTFAFPYKERFCLNCGIATPMFDGNKDVPLTKELRMKKKLVDAIWEVIYSKFLPKGKFGKSNCKKCVGNTNHREHLTKTEIEYDKIAGDLMDKFVGIFVKNTK